MKYLLALSCTLIVLVACDKDKFETKPRINNITAENKLIPIGGTLNVKMNYTDKEGDVDSITVVRNRVNMRGPLTDARLKFKVPMSVKEPEGELTLNLGHTAHLTIGITPIGGTVRERDTLNLQFIVLDKAKNRSDTGRLNGVIVVRQ